jgi:nucleotide-binding universal stress UspA family protein
MSTAPIPAPILAATDFSAPARHAIDRAALLARELGTTLELVHALPRGALDELRAWLGANGPGEDALLGQAREQLEALASEFAMRAPIETRLAIGNVLDELLRAADEIDAGLLVFGAHGTGFLRRLVLGTTSERLLRRARRPVLIVRRSPWGPYRRALVPVDFSPWSAPAIARARSVAPGAHLVLLHVVRVPFEDKLHLAGVDPSAIAAYRRQARAEAGVRLEELARDAGLTPGQWDACLTEGDPALRIAELEEERDCDLVVIGKHGRSAAEEFLLGSVTKHVLAEGAGDVLVSTQGTG